MTLIQYGVIEREIFVATTSHVYSTKDTHSSPHLLHDHISTVDEPLYWPKCILCSR